VGTVELKIISGAGGVIAHHARRDRLWWRGEATVATAAGINGESPQLVGKFNRIHGGGVGGRVIWN